MAQHDYNIANQSGADFRADLNNALLAIATVNSGSTEPSTTFAHQLWVDTSSSVLKIRNAADNAWITTGVSITASNTFTGNLTGNVTGNLTGNVTGNVTGDLTGNADSADILTTARTISLSGDVVGSVSFDGSTNVDIDTVVQINSITLGTDTTGDYVESMSGGTGVTVTGGTGEGSTPSIAIGQAVATTDDVTFNTVTATDEFIGDIDGSVRFTAKADEALSKGDIIYVSGVSGNTPTVGKAKADDASKMPAFGIAAEDANANTNLQIVTLGNLINVDTSNESVGEILYVSTTAGEYSTTAPTGESSQIQNIGKVLRSHAVNGSIKVGGAGRSNATPNLDNGKIFIGNGSNQSTTATLDTSIVVENTNLYYTTARANTDFDSRLATKDTGDLTEGSNLYYTTARVNTDFDTRLATKDTGDLSEGSNLYYTDARVNSAFDTRLATKDTDDVSEGTTNLYYTTSRTNTDFDTRLGTKSTSDLAEGTNLYYTSARFDSAFTSKDTDDLSEGTTNLYYTTTRFDSAFGNKTTADLTENTNLYYTDTRANSAIDARVTKAFVDALNVQAASVDANSVTLGTDTVGNYIQTITGTANKITVSGSGSETADVTLSLPDDVQIADSLTVAGNLTVNGTLTSLDTTNLDIEDNLFQLNAGLTGSPVNDSGMLINRGTADNSIFMWDESVDKFTMGLTTADGSATGNITLNSLGTLVVNVEGNLTGNVTGTVSSLSNHDTDDLAEGSNLYYTQARFDSAFTAKSTSDLSEGTNLYYTDARFDTRLASKDTDDVSEGTSNLYYTSTRFDSAFGGKSTSDLSEGSNLYYTDARVQAVSINNVAEDTTPQLGGNLDLNSSDITGTGDINITGTIQSSGNITGTLATAAQPNITSVGTLTGFTSTGIDDNATSTAITIDSSENVGIGTSSPRRQMHIHNSASATVGLMLTNGNTGESDDSQGLQFKVASDSHAEISQMENSDLRIFTNATEAMRIDSSQNLLVGTTVSNPAGNNSVGVAISSGSYGGFIGVTRDGNTPVEINRKTSDGTLITFRKDSSAVGSIGTQSGRLTIGDGDTGLRFADDFNNIQPFNVTTNVLRDNAIDLGSSAGRFKDLYLSGTANTGGVTLGSNDRIQGTGILFVGGSSATAFEVGAGSEKMRLTSTGLGIGIDNPSKKLHVHATGASEPLGLFQTTSTGDCAVRIEGIGGEAYLEIANTSGTTGDTSNSWGIGCNDDTNLHIAYGTNGTMNKNSDNAQFFINSSTGNIGINTEIADGELHVKGTGGGNGDIYVERTSGAKIHLQAQSANGKIGTISNHNLGLNTNGTTRVTIDTNGNFLVGTTTLGDVNNIVTNHLLKGASTQAGAGAVGVYNSTGTANCPALNVLNLDTSTDSSNRFVQFYANVTSSGATAMGGIVGNGASNVQFATLSDEREKENITLVIGALDKLMNLNVVSFDWKKNDDHVEAGFIAQNVEEHFPEYVVENIANDDDEPRKGTTGGMSAGYIAVLTKAIQEQQELINNLTARIEQLEN